MSKTIIVTGASRGLGKSISKKLSDDKWNVVGIARNKDELYSLKDELNNSFFPYICDISNSINVKSTFNNIFKNFNNVNFLINNAAIFKMDKFHNFDHSEIDSIIDINLKGTMYCTLEFVKYMKQKKNIGRIINIASVASIHGIENQAVYCASKYGLNGFSESLNQEIIKDNISITTIFPGGVNTPLWNKKNEYPGDVKKLLKAEDIVDLIEKILDLENRVILKNLTIFPSNEWH